MFNKYYIDGVHRFRFFFIFMVGSGGGVLILHTGIWRCGSPNYIGGPGFLVKCSWWLRLEQIISGHMRHAEGN